MYLSVCPKCPRKEEEKCKWLVEEIESKRPLLTPDMPMSDIVAEIIQRLSLGLAALFCFVPRCFFPVFFILLFFFFFFF